MMMATAVVFCTKPVDSPHDVLKKAPVWSPCDNDPGLLCARIAVPPDPGKGGPRPSLQLTGHLTNPHLPVQQVFFFDPGGPGLSPGTTMRELLTRFPALDEEGVLVLGVEPLSSALPNRPDCVQATNDNTCEGYFQLLSAAITPESVRRIDAVRDALGVEKISFIGFSYGSVTATQYARSYPKNIRALILDGVVSDLRLLSNKQSRPPTARISDGTGASRLLDERLQVDCHTACSPKRVRSQWVSTLQRLRHQVFRREGLEISYTSAVSAMIELLELPDSSGIARKTSELKKVVLDGQGDVGEAVVFRAANSSRAPLNLPAQWTICSDSGALRKWTPDAVRLWASQNFERTAGFAPFFAQDSQACGAIRARSVPLIQAPLPAVPTLIFAASEDIITPAEHTHELWSQVRRGVLVTSHTPQHLSASSASCARQAFATFLHSPPDARSLIACQPPRTELRSRLYSVGSRQGTMGDAIFPNGGAWEPGAGYSSPISE